MKVCDVCKNVLKSSSCIKIVVFKEETKKGVVSERKIISVEIDLCEEDLDSLNTNIGNMIKTMKTPN